MPAAPAPQRPQPAQRPAVAAAPRPSLVEELKPHLLLALRMLRMDRDAVKELAAQEGSLRVPLILFALSSLCFAIGLVPRWFMMPVRPVMLVAMMALVHVVARSQNGQADWRTMARIASHLFILECVGIIPGVGVLLMLFGSLWYLWILVGVLEEIYGLEQQPAMRVVGISAIALVALVFVGSIVDGAVRGAGKDSLAPGALAPDRPGLKDINP